MINISKIFGKAKTGLLFSAALVMGAGAFMTSCSNGENEFPDFEGGTSVYFAQQYPVRTITLGNDETSNNELDNLHQFKLQATMGGVYKNSKDRKVSYVVDPSLLDDASLEVLPTTYYQLGDANTLTIPSGSIIGGTIVKLTDAFFNDPKSVTSHYVLPTKLVESKTGDKILEEMNYQLLIVKFKNQYSGLYSAKGTYSYAGKTVNRDNKEELLNVTSLSLSSSALSIAFGAAGTADITMEFGADGSCVVKQNGKQIGTGKFTAKGITDFSDVTRQADSLEIKFTADAVTSDGETSSVTADLTLTMQNRNNKFEVWK